MFSEGLRRILEPQFEIVGVSENGNEMLAAAEQLRPDVIIADIAMPSLNGIEAARRLQKMPHRPKIIFLSMHEDATFATAAFRAGASGYVLKRSPPAEMTAAIQEALRGRRYVSSLIAVDLLDLLMRDPERPGRSQPSLTSRQREILQLFAEGKSPKEIAARLKISVRTVEFHKYRIMDVTNARTIAALTRYAIAHGVVTAS